MFCGKKNYVYRGWTAYIFISCKINNVFTNLKELMLNDYINSTWKYFCVLLFSVMYIIIIIYVFSSICIIKKRKDDVMCRWWDMLSLYIHIYLFIIQKNNVNFSIYNNSRHRKSSFHMYHIYIINVCTEN